MRLSAQSTETERNSGSSVRFYVSSRSMAAVTDYILKQTTKSLLEKSQEIAPNRNPTDKCSEKDKNNSSPIKSLQQEIDVGVEFDPQSFSQDLELPAKLHKVVQRLLESKSEINSAQADLLLGINLKNSPALLNKLMQEVGSRVTVLESLLAEVEIEFVDSESEILIENVTYHYDNAPNEVRPHLFLRLGFKVKDKRFGLLSLGKKPIYLHLPLEIRARVVGYERPEFSGQELPKPGIQLSARILSKATSLTDGKSTYITGETRRVDPAITSETRRVNPVAYIAWNISKNSIKNELKELRGQAFQTTIPFPSGFNARNHRFGPTILSKSDDSRGHMLLPYYIDDSSASSGRLGQFFHGLHQAFRRFSR